LVGSNGTNGTRRPRGTQAQETAYQPLHLPPPRWCRRGAAVRGAAARLCQVFEFILVGRLMRDDGRVLAERRLRAAIAVWKQLAEFINRIDRIETDDIGVGAHPRARVNAARPGFQVAPLECLELLALDPCLRDDLIQRDTVSLTVAAQASDEAFLRGHLSLHVDRRRPQQLPRPCGAR